MADDKKWEGRGEQAKGKVKEMTGKATDDEEMQAKGKAEQAKGKAEETAGKAKDKLEDS